MYSFLQVQLMLKELYTIIQCSCSAGGLVLKVAFVKRHRLEFLTIFSFSFSIFGFHFQFSISAICNCPLFTLSEMTINSPKGIMLTVSSLHYFEDLQMLYTFNLLMICAQYLSVYQLYLLEFDSQKIPFILGTILPSTP